MKENLRRDNFLFLEKGEWIENVDSDDRDVESMIHSLGNVLDGCGRT